MKILYRPQKGTLDEAMAEVQEFKSIKEMCKDLVRQHRSAFVVSDVYISYYGYDDRIDWDTYVVAVGRYSDENYMEKYHRPQGIGFCTMKFNREQIQGMPKVMSDKDLELLMRIAGNLDGISATLDENKALANYLCDRSEWIDGIIERCRENDGT